MCKALYKALVDQAKAAQACGSLRLLMDAASALPDRRAAAGGGPQRVHEHAALGAVGRERLRIPGAAELLSGADAGGTTERQRLGVGGTAAAPGRAG